jgi:hypothetical protein
LTLTNEQLPIQNAMEAKDTDSDISEDTNDSTSISDENSDQDIVEDEYAEYLVKAGDSLYSIATTQMSWSIYNSALRMLTEINNIRQNDVLKIGSKILIPQNQINTTNTISYIISEGDTLYSLATKYFPSTDTKKAIQLIMDKNNITNEKELNIGLNVYIPKETTTASTTESKSNSKLIEPSN